MLKFFGLGFGVLFASGLTGSVALAETVPNMLAAQLRTQGFSCDEALGAKKDARRSKPDHEVWTLRCSNATYRVGRAPDMAAKVKVLRQRHPKQGQDGSSPHRARWNAKLSNAGLTAFEST
jgi:hypothetical protein